MSTKFKILVCVSALVWVAASAEAQVIPRQAPVTAAEYFIGNDPGEGKGTPITIPNSSTSVPLDLSSIKLSQGQFIHIGVENSQGTWSAPVNLMYPARTITAAEVVVGSNPGSVVLGHGIPMMPVGGSFGTGVVNVQASISNWNHTDTIWVRARSSQYLWSEPVGNIALVDTILKPVELIAPSDDDTLQLYYPVRPITFSWSRSTITTGIPVEYSFHLVGPGLDTTIVNLQDTTLTTDLMSLLKISSVYGWSVSATDGYAVVASPDSFLFRTSDGITAVHDVNQVPKVFALYQNYPNPFNPTTIIGYDVPRRSLVSLVVYDVLGRRIETLVNGQKQAGHYQVTFDADNLPSGVYFYTLRTGNSIVTKKLTLIK